MKIIKNTNDIGIDYDFNMNDEIKEQKRSYTIQGLDPIVNKNETAIGEIVLTGYNVKLDEIEERLLKAFTEMINDEILKANKCKNFGKVDGMEGSCHYCKQENYNLFEACWNKNITRKKPKESR